MLIAEEERLQEKLGIHHPSHFLRQWTEQKQMKERSLD